MHPLLEDEQVSSFLAVRASFWPYSARTQEHVRSACDVYTYIDLSFYFS